MVRVVFPFGLAWVRLCLNYELEFELLLKLWFFVYFYSQYPDVTLGPSKLDSSVELPLSELRNWSHYINFLAKLNNIRDGLSLYLCLVSNLKFHGRNLDARRTLKTNLTPVTLFALLFHFLVYLPWIVLTLLQDPCKDSRPRQVCSRL